MKASLDTYASKQDDGITRSQIQVCMHVLGTARTDVRVMRAATALAEAGYKVSIVDIEYESDRAPEEEVRGVLLKHVFMPGWSVYIKRPDLWFFARAMVAFIRTLFLLLRTPTDIYHTHDETGLPSCYIAALLRRKPLIFDAHEVPTSARQISIKALLKRCFLLIVPYCRAVITVSPSLVKEFRHLFHCREVCLVRNIPEYQVISKSDRFRQYLGFGSNVRIVLYQGNLQPDRGLDRLVRSAVFLERDIVIILMGRSIKGQQSQLEALIASEGVSDHIKIVPAVPYKELLDWTASADIGLTIFPPEYSLSIRFTLPNKLFEYLMAGVPVLSSQLDAVVDVIHAYDVGQVVPSLAPADLGAAINAMLADQTTLERMHHNALHASQHDLNWEKESLQLIQLYQRILRDGI